jgi:lysozyme
MTTLPNDISLNGLNFTRAREGRALRAYQDSVGVWTVGYGLTNFDKNLPWKIGKDLTINEDQAEWYLVKSLRENYLPACKRELEGGTYQYPQGTLDGAADFHFNTGGIAKATWPKALKRGDLAAAKESLLSWNKAGGKVLNGLTRRREGNWREISAEDYGDLSGPGIIEPVGESNREHQTGIGDILTTFPTDPNDKTAGNVKTDGVPLPYKPAPGVLMFGDKGPAVTDLQNFLTAAGFPTVATGTFDAATVSNVRAFQQAHPNLTDDGKVGPATRETVKRAIAMRETAGKVMKVGLPTIPAAFIALHQWVSANAGWLALAAGVALFLTVGGVILWKHRNDALGWLNSVRGRVVP